MVAMKSTLAALALTAMGSAASAGSLQEQAEDAARRVADQGAPAPESDPGSGALTHAERITEGVMVLAFACDLGGTMTTAARNWRGFEEGGLLARRAIGSTPSPAAVAAYFAGALVASFAVGRVLPKRYRPYFYGAIAAVEIKASVVNLTEGMTGACGFRGAPVMAGPSI